MLFFGEKQWVSLFLNVGEYFTYNLFFADGFVGDLFQVSIVPKNSPEKY